MGVHSLGAIFIRVSNLENSIPFYSALGLRFRGIEDWDPGRAATFYLLPDHDGFPLMTLVESDKVQVLEYHSYNLNATNVREIYRDLELSGYKLRPVEEWSSPWNHHIMFDVYDPDGHPINIIEVIPINQAQAVQVHR
ncbi:VOC family protein [Paenibacillus rhizovicinus]|uniref:VOC family protein n=1 Tax=Paenibacillus rhizovicinus TaxID=2704463 RepID=A0A6C0P3U1_9BACL|nr:VOC family protein [Paenibacillus rhizovicinus]QHW31342.1 VOC family protein [Paenibacillus rhizovicinus]